MRNYLKQLILRTLRLFGYVILKASNYDRLTHAAANTGSSSDTSEKIAKAQIDSQFANSKIGALDREISDQLPTSEQIILKKLLRHISLEQVEGDIVHCGDRSVTALFPIGVMLLKLGIPPRRLVGLDISGNPILQTESELGLWGGGSSDLLSESAKYCHKAICNSAPTKINLLVEGGYPIEKIYLTHDPLLQTIRKGMPEQIAFLSVTSDTYPANREAINLLFKRISIGGIVAVENIRPNQATRDAMDEFLAAQGIEIEFSNISKTYRVGIKPAVQ